MRVAKGVIPPEGFQFIFNNVIIAADNMETLVRKVNEYLILNGLPLGDTERAIQNQICSKYPHFCQQEDADIAHQESLGLHLPTSQRVANWVSRMRASQISYVHPEEALRRSKICEACPNNKVQWETGCAECGNNSKSMAYSIRAGKTVSNNTYVGACELLGTHIETSAWIENNEAISGELEAQLPAECWRRSV